LTTTTAFMIRDFHPIDCTHAGRTKKAVAMTAFGGNVRLCNESAVFVWPQSIISLCLYSF
ncbi:hypothetical protein SB775_20125, partial [Peribacillus sp. SIMBA_075]|uniref:hypothetical protein n=1 Tax=Peribacillus sp. SIMBA_075 TaxID=3085813 RepID=UPI00397D7D49